MITEAFRSFQPTEATVPLWSALLAEYEAEDVQGALIDYLKTGKFPPVPSDIISRVKDIQKARKGELSPEQLWLKSFAHSSSFYEAGTLAERFRHAGIPESQIESCVRVINGMGVERLIHLDIESEEFGWARKEFLNAIKSELEHARKYEIAAEVRANPQIRALIGSVKTIN